MIEEMKAKVVKPLTGLKVACYYGCLAVRPPELTGVAQYENPEHMDRLMEIVGGRGGSLVLQDRLLRGVSMMTRTDIVVDLSQRILSMALEAGADCIVTGCSMCHANLDTRQAGLPRKAEKTKFLFFILRN